MKDEQRAGNGKPTSTIWAGIGKLSAILALLIGLRTVYVWIYPSGADLTAICYEQPFVQSPDIERALDAYKEFPSEDIILNAITNSSSYEISNKVSVDRAASSLWIHLRQAKLSDSVFEQLRPGYYTFISIRNHGDKVAEQLVLPLASGTATALITRDAISKSQKVSGAMELGSLRPEGKITVEIWSSSTILPYSGSAMLSSSSGVTKVGRPTELYGAGGQIGAFVNSLIETPILMITVLILFFFLLIPVSLFVAQFFGYKSPPDDNDEQNKKGKKRKGVAPTSQSG